MAVAWDPATIAGQLMACVCEELEKERVLGEGPGWVGQCCVRPGGGEVVPWDSCDENGGQAWVVFKRAYPTTNFPNGDTASPTVCGNMTSLAVVFEVGVVRCVGTGACDCEKHEADAALVFGDMTAVIQGINCCLGMFTDDDCDDLGWRLNGFETLGPKGGCAGSKFEVVINMAYPCCEEAQ